MIIFASSGRRPSDSVKVWVADKLIPRAAAWLDSKREVIPTLGGPLNGQLRRQEMMLELLTQLDPVALIETGTFLGDTTEWFAQSFSGPITTIEINRRFFHFARRKLRSFPNITLIRGDSERWVCKLTLESPVSEGPTLFYLDAHWGAELPLVAELACIARNCREAVVVVDDFAVEGDAGYEYDDYGPEKTLRLGSLPARVLETFEISFPRSPSETETGARRGCIVLSSGGQAQERLRSCKRLRWVQKP